jgi:Protein of unknown function (DUF3775)
MSRGESWRPDAARRHQFLKCILIGTMEVTAMQKQLRQTDRADDEDESPLTISPEKVCFIIIKAKEFDAKDEVTEPDPGSNPSDDKDAAVLEEHEDDPVVEELTSLIDSLSEDEQVDLVALAWLGRDDYSASDWPAVREEAARVHNQRTAEYLLGMPLVGDFLEEGLSMLGFSCEEFEIERL